MSESNPAISPTPEPQNTPLESSRYTYFNLTKLHLGLITGFALLCFVANPSQNRHLEEVIKVAALRDPSRLTTEYQVVTRFPEYNDYLIFSTISFGNNGYTSSEYTLTYGFLGFVKTTGYIRDVMLDIAVSTKNQREKETAPK